MLIRSRSFRRQATTLAEAALVYPVMLSLVAGVVIVAMCVFRYQLVAGLAREGARWASVHGGQWAADKNGGTLTTTSNVYTNAIQPLAAGLVTSSGVTVSYANSGQMPTYTSSGLTTTNTVTVTVTCSWTPVAYLGTVTLSSTSVMAMQY